MIGPQKHPLEGSSRQSDATDVDVTAVVHALHRTGPLSLHELMRVPGLDAWPDTRLEHAVVVAWSRNLISVNPGDEFVAL